MRATTGSGTYYRNKTRPTSPWRYRLSGVEIDGVVHKPVQAYGRTRTIAKQKVDKKIAEIKAEVERQAKIRDGVDVDQTVDEYLMDWYTTDKTKSPSTVDAREYAISVMRPYIGHKLLKKLRGEHVQNMLSALDGKYHPNTIWVMFAHLKKALNDAALMDAIPFNPCNKVPAKPRKVAVKHEWLTAEERYKLCSLNEPYTPMFTLMSYCGLRPGEATALTWDKVDLDACEVRVDCTANLTKEKGLHIQPTTKSKSSRRVVPMPEVVVAALKRHRSTQSVTSLKGLVFPRKKAQAGDSVEDSILGAPQHSVEFKRSLKKIGVERHVTPHDCRHTAATLMVKGGADILGISKILGHESIKQTYDTYIHSDPDDVRDAVTSGASLDALIDTETIAIGEV